MVGTLVRTGSFLVRSGTGLVLVGYEDEVDMMMPLCIDGTNYEVSRIRNRRRNTCKHCLQNFMEIDQELTKKA